MQLLDMVIDATHAYVGNIPLNARGVMGYVTQATPESGIQWADEDWARFPYAGKMRIDQSGSLSPFATLAADVADIEYGAGTMGAFLTAARERKGRGHDSTLYISYDNFESAVQDVASSGLSSSVLYAIADWSLSLEQASAFIGARNIQLVQWASPTSNPDTLVPGSTKTLAEAKVDLSVKASGWFGSSYPSATIYVEG